MKILAEEKKKNERGQKRQEQFNASFLPAQTYLHTYILCRTIVKSFEINQDQITVLQGEAPNFRLLLRGGHFFSK